MTSEETKYVYAFGGERADGDASMKELLGGKGANLAEMASIGIPVPAGFTISTDMCNVYAELDGNYPPELERQVKEAMAHVEETMGARFGDPENPLLVSVRSGARVSMPGMMDTVLNLGLNEDTLTGLIEKTDNERFAWDSYRRFVQMYGDVVLGMKPESKEEEDPFEVIIEKVKEERGVELDTDLDVDALKDLVDRFKKLVADKKGVDFPTDPWEQLWGAVNAVFGSWNNPRAIRYRKLNDIPGDWGTAVNVQAMVYGNMGDDCATGVAFTRDPATGENRFYGEFLVNAQGEDVVAGTRTPQQVNVSGRDALPAGNPSRELPTLEEVMPDVYKELDAVQKKLEAHYKDMQDIEFTIQDGTLWMLQTRTGKRTSAAAVRIAVEMVDEGIIDTDTAVLRVSPGHLDQLLHPTFDPKADKNVIAGGLPASPGAAAGKVVFHADDAEVWADKGEKVILVRIETSPEDIGGMDVAQGILTARGGMTSHAAVVARGMGKCCVAGAGDLKISYAKKEFTVGDTTVKEGDWISIDGTTGEIMLGQVPTVKPQLTGNFGKLMAWADEARRLGVRTNADTPKDAKVALDFGAEGIGLCRTEHMFFEGDRIKAVREMILADDEAGRKKALDKLLPIQRDDFYELFKACAGKSVTIRLLDPPLHEFVPHEADSQQEMADELGVSADKIKAKVESLAEFNPMLGHRGCRLGITYPEITAMQTRAIIEAAAKIKEEGNDVVAEIMVPLVGTVAELREQKKVIKEAAEAAIKDGGTDVEYHVGTMIEIPRAALTAGELAEEGEFFSFGTNDLTQMTFGYSRDDAGRFLKDYLAKGILAKDPFQSLDQEGVGQLVRMGFERGRATRGDLKVGICGEHGGDPASIEFCHQVGLDYVSCSPYRVPIARLAAAQAAIREKNG